MIDEVELDAIIIATPDHHHIQAAMLALQAGLDVYLEKLISVTIREGRLPADAVKTTGRVLQVGSQHLSMEMNRFACEFLPEGGLGKVSRIEFPNFPGPMKDPKFDAQPIPKGLDCIESRQSPNAPVEVGHRTITVCHLVNIARELQRPLQWNPDRERFVDDAEADNLLDRPRREHFPIPSITSEANPNRRRLLSSG